MWIQAMAIILPRVQRHFLRAYFLRLNARTFTRSLHLPPFAVPDNHIGILSSSMFAGMMIGAVGWGTCELSLFLVS